MKSPFLHMIDPASVLAAARRLQTVAPATRQGGRDAQTRRARDESDPEVDDILEEIEARQSDEGDFDAFLDRIGAGTADAPRPDAGGNETGDDLEEAVDAAASIHPAQALHAGAPVRLRPMAGAGSDDAEDGGEEGDGEDAAADDEGDPVSAVDLEDDGDDPAGDISDLVDTSDLQDADPDALG